jgi:hypothetical protein
MRYAKLFGLALVAVFALGAVMSGSASAQVWEECSEHASVLEFQDELCGVPGPPDNFGWTPITVAKLSDGLGELLLEDTSTLLGASAVKCHSIDHGKVGPGDKGLISSINLDECVPEKICQAPITAKIINLPWSTLLETVEGKIRDKITSEIAGKNIGWELTCKTIGGTMTDKCETASTTMGMDNNTTSGDVKELVDSLSTTVKCSLGNATSGHVTGFYLITGLLPSGGDLGIRVR